jgi:excisionase family DNA binding protein
MSTRAGPSEAEDRLLGVREAAAKLGVSPKTVYQWAYERRLPVVKLFGKALRFRLSVIEKLIAVSERPALRSPSHRSQDSA